MTKAIIMIVDDTPGNLALLSDTLSESGYRILVATDGLSVLEQIAFLKPDIILLDVMMPGIDGFETCKRLKDNPDTCAFPVIFMTALSKLDDLLRGFEEGAVDYLVKPIRPPEVLARVDSQLKQIYHRQRAENALNNTPYAALAFNALGHITWLPHAGAGWFSAFLALPVFSESLKIGSLLPQPLLNWVKQQHEAALAPSINIWNIFLKNWASLPAPLPLPPLFKRLQILYFNCISLRFRLM